MRRNVVTIATGNAIYSKMATNLARSFRWWHIDTDIEFTIITDKIELIPTDVREYIKIKEIKSGEFGEGFSPKLYLDKLSPLGYTLFIDSDCLIFGNLDMIFTHFRGHKVSVIGNYIEKGEWFGDIQSICRKFCVPHLPKFNGGVYYLEKGEIANNVYKNAREIENIYDEVGFVRLRNRPNDEVIMALAMQLNKQWPIPDDGTILSDPQACQGELKIDILKGKRYLTNPPHPHPKHQSWYRFTKVNPVIIHFLGQETKKFPYKRESYRIKRALEGNRGIITDLIGKIGIQLPVASKVYFKNALRPLFRFLVGTRKIKTSERT